MSIGVIGLGKAGLPLAAVVADSGFDVVGVDIDAAKCELINRGVNPIPEEPGLDELIKNLSFKKKALPEKYYSTIKEHGGTKLIATPRYEDAVECTVFIILVPLVVDERYNPDFSILEAAIRGVGTILKNGDLVVLETTVPPMTTETLVKKWLEDECGLSLENGDFYLAHSPERIMTGYSISRLREFPKVIGGVDEASGAKAFAVYKHFIPNLHLVANARTAEFIKIIEGCYRDVNIALANELFKIANELKINFEEAREYANHEYCHIHLPSTGVGGHCIPLYPWFLIKEMEKRGKFSYTRLLRTGRDVNDEMITYWAEKIVQECMKLNKPLRDVKICIKGLTFRAGVKELYHSRNLALATLLSEKGLNVYAYDELLSNEELEAMGLRWLEPDEADLIFDSFELKLERLETK